MKKSLILSFAFFFSGCGGPDVSKFIGGTWTGTESTTVSCGGSSGSGGGSLTLTLSEGTDSALTAQGPGGCIAKFSVDGSGETATLSNGPVTCSITSNGMTQTETVTVFTLKTSDGHNLTAHSEGTFVAGGQSCSFVMDGTATK
jgi:hypothetical protein